MRYRYHVQLQQVPIAYNHNLMTEDDINFYVKLAKQGKLDWCYYNAFYFDTIDEAENYFYSEPKVFIDYDPFDGDTLRIIKSTIYRHTLNNRDDAIKVEVVKETNLT